MFIQFQSDEIYTYPGFKLSYEKTEGKLIQLGAIFIYGCTHIYIYVYMYVFLCIQCRRFGWQCHIRQVYELVTAMYAKQIIY